MGEHRQSTNLGEHFVSLDLSKVIQSLAKVGVQLVDTMALDIIVPAVRHLDSSWPLGQGSAGDLRDACRLLPRPRRLGTVCQVVRQVNTACQRNSEQVNAQDSFCGITSQATRNTSQGGNFIASCELTDT